MIMNTQREKCVQAKKEGEGSPLENKQIPRLSTTTTTTPSTRQLGGFKNPRIVRVSRGFGGGKDRHSKVCTIRGLRDRRIRLSVQTAIQLYDLQDTLGLSQPSKVVDWLLDVAKNEIDELPPLQIPPGGLFPKDYCSSTMLENHSQVFGTHSFTRGDISTSSPKDCHQENLEKYEGYLSHHHQLSAQNFFPSASQTSTLNNNNGLSYHPNYLHWGSRNLTISPFGIHSVDSQILNNSNTASNNSSSDLQQPPCSSQHQFYFCPPIPSVPSILPPRYSPSCMTLSSSMENNEQSMETMRNFQLSCSSSQHVPNN